MIGEARLRMLRDLHDQADGAAVLKTTERGRVTRVRFDDVSDAVCKEDRPPTLRSRLGASIRGSRATRAWQAARALQDAGFHVPEPLGLLEADGRSLYVARFVDGPSLQIALDDADRDTAGALVMTTALLTARLHTAGFAFRDLKPSNLVLTEGELVPVDLDDVTRPRHLPRRIAWRNLASLDAYAQLSGQPPSAGARWRALVVYAGVRGLEPRDLLATILDRSREKRRRLKEVLHVT